MRRIRPDRSVSFSPEWLPVRVAPSVAAPAVVIPPIAAHDNPPVEYPEYPPSGPVGPGHVGKSA